MARELLELPSLPYRGPQLGLLFHHRRLPWRTFLCPGLVEWLLSAQDSSLPNLAPRLPLSLRIESALRNAMPDADISLPFWDECLTYGSDDNPIPWVLTAPKFPLLDGDNSNPLNS